MGAVLVPTSIFHRLTPYQRATRWIVLAKHCAPMYASIHVGTASIGNVVWQSATRTLSLCGYRPSRTKLRCCTAHPTAAQPFAILSSPIPPREQSGLHAARRAGGASCCSRLVERARWAVLHKRLAHRRPMRVARLLSNAWNLETELWRINTAHASELHSIDNGDSGGPVVTYDRHLIGIISSGEPGGRSIVYYTPMQQVLHEAL